MICHHYKCVFIHIPKNAGISIEHVFLDLLNLTWETRAPLLLRYNDAPEIGPPRLAHLKASEYVRYKYMTEEMFDRYFKFSFVRNPWSRAVSFYRYLGYSNRYDFRTFIMSIFTQKLFKEMKWFVGPQSDFLCDENGNMLVDFVGRYENLQSDFEQVCSKIGLSPIELPCVNKTEESKIDFSLKPKKLAKYLLCNLMKRKIPGFSTYQEYYDEETKYVVSELYRGDIKLFGYEFEQDFSNDKISEVEETSV